MVQVFFEDPCSAVAMLPPELQTAMYDAMTRCAYLRAVPQSKFEEEAPDCRWVLGGRRRAVLRWLRGESDTTNVVLLEGLAMLPCSCSELCHSLPESQKSIRTSEVKNEVGIWRAFNGRPSEQACLVDAGSFGLCYSQTFLAVLMLMMQTDWPILQ